MVIFFEDPVRIETPTKLDSLVLLVFTITTGIMISWRDIPPWTNLEPDPDFLKRLIDFGKRTSKSPLIFNSEDVNFLKLWEFLKFLPRINLLSLWKISSPSGRTLK